MNSIHEALAVVRKFPAACQPTSTEALGSAGGMSGAQFWRMQSPRGTLVLRRWPAEHPTPERLQYIHDVLFHAEENGIEFLAVPIRAEANISFISDGGHLWELAPWMLGVASYASSPTTEKLRVVMMALAKFHAAVADFPRSGFQHLAGAAPAISRRLDRLRQIAEGGLAVMSQTINERVWPDLAPLARRFIATVPASLPSAIGAITLLANTSFTVQPCLRDIWHDHVLFTGDVVTGIIDYGAIDFDTPATDVARLLGSLVNDDPVGWNEGLAAYRTVRPLTDDEEFAVRVLNVSGPIVAGYNWLRWIYIDGREFENRGQIIERFRRILAVCEARPR